jgi:hypothetical protein
MRRCPSCNSDVLLLRAQADRRDGRSARGNRHARIHRRNRRERCGGSRDDLQRVVMDGSEPDASTQPDMKASPVNRTAVCGPRPACAGGMRKSPAIPGRSCTGIRPSEAGSKASSGNPQAPEQRDLDEIQEHRKDNCREQHAGHDRGRQWRHGDPRYGEDRGNEEIAKRRQDHPLARGEDQSRRRSRLVYVVA